MAKVPVCISVDPEVKAQAQELFADFGLDLSTAINIFLRQSIRENCIPFTIQREVPNADTIAAMKEADDMANNPERYENCNNIDDLKKSLEDVIKEDSV